MNSLERIDLLLSLERKTRRELAGLTGIPESRWNSVMNKRARLSMNEVEALIDVWPDYAYWLVTGKELPESGQVSPLTKKASS
tara:strand:+ start:25490 stop:25738 length:249 start_codon:yes stop_codon:yes gene_type:complete